MALEFTRFPLLDISDDDIDATVGLISKQNSEHSTDIN